LGVLVISSIFVQSDAKRRRVIEERLINQVFEIYDRHKVLGLKDRIGQVNMSLDIIESYVNKKNLLIEAGVGIGKSFGYLIPSLLINKLTNKPIIIATSSIQLSEQLLRDIRSISDKLKIPVSSVLGKGMNHYGCASRAFEITNESNYKKKHGAKWKFIDAVYCGTIKERSDFKFPIDESTWNKINVKGCTFEKCNFKDDCAFYHMRNSIANYSFTTDIIVVNQDLLIRDIIKRNNTGKGFIASNPAMIVIDEAHNLEDKVRSALTTVQNKLEIEKLLYRAIKRLDIDYSKDVKEFIEINDNLFLEIIKNVDEVKKDSTNESERYKVITSDKIDYSKLIKIIEDIKLTVSLNEERNRERENDELIVELNSLLNLYRILDNRTTDYLIWATQNNSSSNIELHYCPKYIKDVLKQGLFEMSYPVILTSATLCQDGEDEFKKYEYIKNELGFIGELAEPKPSPYDYQNNAIFYISKDMPHYNSHNKREYLDAAISQIKQLCDITKGRTIVLLTAKEDMQYIQDKMKLISTSWEKHFQIEGSNQEKVINDFINSKGVLFGTGVFWEGIDIPGSDLTQVIIVRLPFPVPNDPIIEYKTEIASDSMTEVMIPNMLIRLRQGAGRLIRTETDTGVLAILDSRLSSNYQKNYSKSTLDSLPFNNITESIEEVERFVKDKVLINY